MFVSLLYFDSWIICLCSLYDLATHNVVLRKIFYAFLKSLNRRLVGEMLNKIRLRLKAKCFWEPGHPRSCYLSPVPLVLDYLSGWESLISLYRTRIHRSLASSWSWHSFYQLVRLETQLALAQQTVIQMLQISPKPGIERATFRLRGIIISNILLCLETETH